MAETYRVVLPSGAQAEARRAVDAIRDDDFRDHGLGVCRAYFSGTALMLRLDGDGQGLLDRFARTRAGAGVLDVLRRHGLDAHMHRLQQVASSDHGGHGRMSAMYDVSIVTGHEDEVRRRLAEIVRDLPAHVEAYVGPSVGDALILHVEADRFEDVEALLQESPLSRFLSEHTAYTERGWRTPLSFSTEDVHERSAMSQDEVRPDDTARATHGFEEGPWAPPEGFRNSTSR